MPQRAIDAGGRVVGHGEDELPVPRPRHRASLERRAELRSARSTSCSRPAGSASRRAATARSSARPTARAAASTGRSAISSRAGATSATPSIARYIAGVWGIDEQELPGPGVDAYELFRKIDRGEIKGLLSICFNPKVSLPDNAFITRCLEKLEFYAAIDFFLNDTARHADIVLPGSLQEEDEGTVTQVEGRIIKINKAVDCPGEARAGLAHHPGHRAGARPAARLHVRRARARSSRSCASPARAASPTTPASPTRRSTQQIGVFWPCYSEDPQTGAAIDDHPGTPRLFEPGSYNPVAKGSGPFYFPDGTRALQRRRLSAAGGRRERRVSDLS